MAKKIKTPNQFAAPSEGVQVDSPVETPAPTVRTKRDGTPFKVRGKNTVNPKIAEFRNSQKRDMATYVAQLKSDRQQFFKTLRVETEAAKVQARMEKRFMDLTPEEKAWMDKHDAKILAEKAAKANALHPDPVPEEQQNDQP